MSDSNGAARLLPWQKAPLDEGSGPSFAAQSFMDLDFRSSILAFLEAARKWPTWASLPTWPANSLA